MAGRKVKRNERLQETSSTIEAERSEAEHKDRLSREKFDPAMRKPDATSTAPPVGGLGAVAARLAEEKKKKAKAAQQAKALKGQ